MRLEGDRLAVTAGLPEGVDDGAQGVDGPRDGDESVGPRADQAGGLGGDGRPDEQRRGLGQAPHARAIHTHETVVGHLLAAQQRADHLDALEEPGVPSAFTGHRSPVTCSFTASPEPSAAQKRPGNMSASVAIAWAVTAGW